MNETSIITLSNICCTCLCTDRKLSRLCDIDEGVNTLFFLLSSDSEAYEEVCDKDAINNFICWECKALMHRLYSFRQQACVAQKQLHSIVNSMKKTSTNNLSVLSKYHQDFYNYEYISNDFTPATYDEHRTKSIKMESISELHDNIDIKFDENDIRYEPFEASDTYIKPESSINESIYNDYNINIIIEDKKINPINETVQENVNYPVIRMREAELLDNIKKRRSVKSFLEAKFKCDTCIEVYSDNKELQEHMKEAHKAKTYNCTSVLSKYHHDLGVDDYEYLHNFTPAATYDEHETKSIKSENISEPHNNIDMNLDKKDIKHEPIEASDNCTKPEGSRNETVCTDCNIDVVVEDKKINDVCIKPNIDKSMKNDESHNILNNDKEVHPKKEIVEENINYTVIRMTEVEMLESIEKRRSAKSFIEAKSKCDMCIEVYRDDKELQVHMKEAHKEQTKYKKCDICKVYVRNRWFYDHRSDHYLKFTCHYCDQVFYNVLIMLKHLRVGHIVTILPKGLCKLRKISYLKNPGLKPWLALADVSPDEGTSRGFVCSQCQKCFQTKSARSRHVTKVHTRPNFKCSTCGKTFVTAYYLENHKRYECIMCKRGFRTLRDLNDHVNYAHMERTHHKCPICNKALATPRGVTRHVRRAHMGMKVNVGEKIMCRTCGKACRDKRTLLEHELIHTGEKPLSCDICGRSFRQNAALYTHKRRVHKMALKRQIIHMDDVNTLNIKE